MTSKLQNFKTSKLGFTLVETIVAVFIFTIVMTVAAGAILSIINVSRKAQSLSSVMNNLNLALDTMSRDIRFGSDYQGYEGCVAEFCTGVTFANKEQVITSYYLDNGQLFKKIIPTSGAPTVSAVTAKEVILDRMNFYIISVDSGAVLSLPRVLFVARGEIMSKGVILSAFDIQTTVTQRTI